MAIRTREIKPSQKAVKVYYAEMEALKAQRAKHEQAVRQPFATLLTETAKTRKWTFVAEQSVKAKGKTIRPDGTMRDEFHMPRGFWEAKDLADDLDKAISAKIKQGYPTVNTIFQHPELGVLYQNGREHLRADLTDPKQLVTLLNEFYKFEAPNIENFEHAIAEFSEQVADLAKGLLERIEEAHQSNEKFKTVYGEFFDLCRKSLNPNLAQAAVDEMLIQHLLTERLIRKIFDNPDFVSRNVIAAKVEEVISAMASRSFSRHDYLRSLDRFYVAIEEAARDLDDFSEKQHFLNKVYERFFQGYSVKVADTHGIVYTPQEIVDFMCASVEHVLKEEFGQDLGSDGVVVLDPCTGTGNFIVNLINRVKPEHLKDFYASRLFANEVMLMPYYIAALNIEHAYYERMGVYESFEGLCFVDTLDMTEHRQVELSLSERNTWRIEQQNSAPIKVIIGNPPYNIGQLNENDNNKNREYKVVERAVTRKYARDSRASSKKPLGDAYVKFFRWATDRLGERDGIVCLVSNNSFVDDITFDGMRKHLMQDFTRIYHLDLHGNVRKNPTISGTSHNVFGIQVGVGITVAVRRQCQKVHKLRYYRVPEQWRREDKLGFLRSNARVNMVKWDMLKPDSHNTWLVPAEYDEFQHFSAIGIKEQRAAESATPNTIFVTYSLGVSTNRDKIVYDYDRSALMPRVKTFVEDYNAEVDRYSRLSAEPGFNRKSFRVDDFVNYDKVKWSRDLKQDLLRCKSAEYTEGSFRTSLYRPFCRKWFYFDRILNEEVYVFPHILPTEESERNNRVICVPSVGNRGGWSTLVSNVIPSLALTSIDAFQCFPFYTYDEDGSNRRENITDWALKEFRKQYKNKRISKWDIFYYIYGLLHHPGYREKYADCLKRELPRIPYAPDFKAFSTAGKKLAKWHLEYEEIEPYPLTFEFDQERPASYVVADKMRLSRDKKTLRVNESLTLSGIPAEAFEYRLGNRSALDWVVDQYRVKVDKRSGIRSDPNRKDDPEYIVRLVGQVIRVSLETVEIVKGLPRDFGG